MNGFILPSKDLIRVLTPVDDFNKSAGPGLPFRIGKMDCFADASAMPRSVPSQIRSGDITQMGLKFLFEETVQEEFYSKITAVINENAILDLGYGFQDEIEFYEDDTILRQPHMDGGPQASYAYTVTAGFPTGTVYYPSQPSQDGFYQPKGILESINMTPAVQAAPSDIIM